MIAKLIDIIDLNLAEIFAPYSLRSYGLCYLERPNAEVAVARPYSRLESLWVELDAAQVVTYHRAEESLFMKTKQIGRSAYIKQTISGQSFIAVQGDVWQPHEIAQIISEYYIYLGTKPEQIRASLDITGFAFSISRVTTNRVASYAAEFSDNLIPPDKAFIAVQWTAELFYVSDCAHVPNCECDIKLPLNCE